MNAIDSRAAKIISPGEIQRSIMCFMVSWTPEARIDESKDRGCNTRCAGNASHFILFG
jgi:hypothetical protein